MNVKATSPRRYVTIKLSTDADDDTDEKIFFYCNSIDGFKSL